MIGIIGAMEEEVQALRHAMKIQEEKEIASWYFIEEFYMEKKQLSCEAESERSMQRFARRF